MNQHNIIWITDNADLRTESFNNRHEAYEFAESLNCKFAYVCGNVSEIDITN